MGETHQSRRGVRKTYRTIADHFAVTRQDPWESVVKFINDAPTGRYGLDIGCANGRHFEALGRRCQRVIGVDLSRPLLKIAAETAPRNVELCQADATALPVPDDTISVGLSIATIHHLPDRQSRRSALKEIGRVLKPSGRALVSVWSVTADRFDEHSSATDTTVKWTLPDGSVVDRYYHLYDEASFNTDLNAAGVGVESSFIDGENLYAVVSSPPKEKHP